MPTTTTRTRIPSTPLDAFFDRAATLTRAMEELGSVRRAFGEEAAASPGDQQQQQRAPQLWLPAIDTWETAQAFVIAADLPGVRQEDIDLHFEQGTLTLSGQRAATIPAPAAPMDGTDEEKDAQPSLSSSRTRVFTSERVSGAFVRSVRLPEYVDGERIEATYADGVLTVHVPKAQGARARKINVLSGTGSRDARRVEG